jgi:hypothetical protein
MATISTPVLGAGGDSFSLLQPARITAKVRAQKTVDFILIVPCFINGIDQGVLKD